MAEQVKTVFVNGCFDLLHVGHVFFLAWASCHGRLIVGLNSDASVRRLKGDDRPFVVEWQRRALLQFCKGVDSVRVFDEDTPLGLLQDVRPDIYIVGPDHATDCDLCDFVRSYGGQVDRAPVLAVDRTTDIVRRLQEAIHV